MMQSLDYIIILIIINYNDTLSGDNEIISNKQVVVDFYRVYIYTIIMSLSLKIQEIRYIAFYNYFRVIKLCKKEFNNKRIVKKLGFISMMFKMPFFSKNVRSN